MKRNHKPFIIFLVALIVVANLWLYNYRFKNEIWEIGDLLFMLFIFNGVVISIPTMIYTSIIDYQNAKWTMGITELLYEERIKEIKELREDNKILKDKIAGLEGSKSNGNKVKRK